MKSRREMFYELLCECMREFKPVTLFIERGEASEYIVTQTLERNGANFIVARGDIRNGLTALYYAPYRTWFVEDDEDKEDIIMAGGVGANLVMVGFGSIYKNDTYYVRFNQLLQLPEADQQLFLNQILLGDTQ